MVDDLRRGPSGPIQELTTSDIVNTSTLPGATITDVFDLVDDADQAIPPGFPPIGSGSTPARAGRPGYTSRHVYVNALSTRLGTSFAGVICEAAPTVWSLPEHIPPGGFFIFVQTGAAAGAGSGCANRAGSGSFSVNGGGPSGGAAINVWTATRAELIAALPISFTTPLGGVGGNPVTGNSITTTNGLDGSPGGDNVISGTGLIEMACAGSIGTGGVGGTTGNPGSGGGRLSAAPSTTQGGMPYDAGPTVNSTQFNFTGGARSNTRTSTGSSGVQQWAIYGGAGGGSNLNASTIVHGGRAQYGGSGGGHGGRTTIPANNFIQASDGGNHDVTLQGNPGGGGGGAAGASNGQDGQPGPDGNASRAGEGGGGGMAANGATAPTVIGGRGGDGGFPGGGAGGGGAAFSQSGIINSTSGRGGKGGDSATIVTGY